jgi:ssDNA-specific exonuclease RecJ
MYRLSTSSKVVCKKLYKFIYEDSYFYLNRKFEKFSHYVNTEESQLIAEFRNA